MTVASTTAQSGPFYPNGVTTSFAFDFAVMAAEELLVVSVANGAESVVSSALYSVALNSDGTGAVIFLSAPVSGPALYIRSDPDLDQNLSITNSGAFLPQVVEQGFDRAAIRDLAIKLLASSGLRVPLNEDAPGILPAAALRASKLLGFDASGQPIAYAATAGASADMVALLARSPVNVRDPAYGAVGDGVADDSAAIQAAINTGRSVFLPGGIYAVKSLAFNQASQTIFGPGTLKFNGNRTQRLGVVSVSDVTFEGVTFDGGLSQPYFSLVSVSANAARPRFTGCTFQNLTGIYTGSTPVNQMYALSISPYGVVDLQVWRCRFLSMSKKNDGTGLDTTSGLAVAAFEGGGFVGGIVFMDGDGSAPTAAQATPTSGIVQGCVFRDIQTVLAGGLSDADRIRFDDADAIRFYEVNNGEGTVDVLIADCQFRKVSKRAVKISARGVTVTNIDIYATDCAYFMVTAIKVNPDSRVSNIRVHASVAKPVYTAFQLTGTPSSVGWRYADILNVYVSHCLNGVEFYTLTAPETLENVTIDGLKVVQCYGAGVLQTIPTGPIVPAAMRNIRIANVDIDGGDANAGGIVLAGSTDGSCGASVSRVKIRNGNIKVPGTGNAVDDVVIEIPSGSSWTGYSSTAGLVEIGSSGLNGQNRVTGLTVEAPGLPNTFINASRQYAVLLLSNNLRATNVDVKVSETLAVSYPHVQIGGSDIEVNGLTYDGPGTVGVGVLVSCQRATLSGLSRKASTAASGDAFITSSNASNTSLLFFGVTDHRRTTVSSLALSSGALGTGDTYVHMVQGLRTRSQAALPSTSGTVHISDAVKF